MRMRTLVVVALLLSASSMVQAQSVDPKWEAWLGCWTPEARGAETPDMTVCVVPSADGRGVSMRSFAGERELLAEPFTADGSTQSLNADGCTGERVSQWARSGARFFSKASLTCSGKPSSTTSSVSALVRTDLWLDVQVTAVKEGEQVRTRRLRRATGAPPASVADALRSLRPARVTPSAVSVDDVLEANTLVSATAVEAWLAESGARASLDRQGLVRLADAKVEERVIDLLVAMAYPQKFEVRRSSNRGGGGGGFFGGGGGFDDGFYPGDWGYLADVYGYGFGSFGLPYFLGGSGYLPGSVYYVPNVGGGGGTTAPDTDHGQVVNGQGYTRVQPREPYRGTATASGGSGARGSSTAGDASGNSSGSSGSSGDPGSSGATPSGYSGGGGGSTGQTAVPR